MVNDGKYSKMWISDGIVHVVYKPLPIIDLKAAKVVVRQRLELQNEISLPVLCDLRQVDNAHKEARDYLAIEGSLMTEALALLVRDRHAVPIARLFLSTGIGSYPADIFLDKEKAIRFLKGFG